MVLPVEALEAAPKSPAMLTAYRCVVMYEVDGGEAVLL